MKPFIATLVITLTGILGGTAIMSDDIDIKSLMAELPFEELQDMPAELPPSDIFKSPEVSDLVGSIFDVLTYDKDIPGVTDNPEVRDLVKDLVLFEINNVN